MHKLVVSPETARMIQLGHPWVIADRFTGKWPVLKPGELAYLLDEQERFLATALIDPADRVVARIIAFNQVELTRKWMLERLDKALKIRTGFISADATDAYRLVNAEGDGIPGLTIDRYGKYIMLQLYTEAWRPHMKLVTSALQELCGPCGIYEKTRPRNTRELEAVSDSKKYGRLLTGVAAPGRFEVRENGLSFLVSLEEGLNTGLFLDQRENRRELTGFVAGKRFLNLFSYTGAFSVAAAAAGASQVTSLDLSQGYTDWNRSNFELNSLNPGRHRFIVGDCIGKMASLRRDGELFDIILMDPPSFSTAGKGRLTTKGGTSNLVAASLPLLKQGGMLITSSNHQKTDIGDYLKELRRGALEAGDELRVVGQRGQPADFPYPLTFPEGRYLKYIISVKD